MFADSLQRAVKALEHELSIQIDPFSHLDEHHDAVPEQHQSYWPFRLDNRPVSRVRACRIAYGTSQQQTIPEKWINVFAHDHGVVHLVPTGGALTGFVYSGSLPLLMQSAFTPTTWIPGFFRFDYDSGFQTARGTVTIPAGERDASVTFDEAFVGRYDLDVTFDDPEITRGVTGYDVTHRDVKGFALRLRTAPQGGDLTLAWTASTIPADLKAVIGMMAAMLPLNIAGDLIAGAGIANFSISMDGLSQSIGTTASATNAGYGARVLQFRKEIDQHLPALRARYRMPNIALL